MFKLSTLVLLAFALAGALVARAQTSNQVNDCLGSLRLITHETNPVYSTADDTHFYNATYTFDYQFCGNVSLNKIQLVDLDGGFIYNCPNPGFNPTGSLYSQCSQTLGFIARAARDNGDIEWSMNLQIGPATNRFTLEKGFYVTYYDPPAPSGTRKRRSNTQEIFRCEQGQSYCRTDSKSFECVDTSSNIYSCGACPYDLAAKDCTAIEGVNNVECRRSSCYVNSCLRGYQVSPDRKNCVPNKAKAKKSVHRRR